MCLAVPARVERIEDETAVVSIAGVEREASLALVPEARVGDYVLLHAGFAIQVVDEREAAETLRLLHELGEMEPEAQPSELAAADSELKP